MLLYQVTGRGFRDDRETESLLRYGSVSATLIFSPRRVVVEVTYKGPTKINVLSLLAESEAQTVQFTDHFL